MIAWNDQCVSILIETYVQFAAISTTHVITVFSLYAAYSSNGTRNPISVFTRAYIYFMQNLEAHDLVSVFFNFIPKCI